MGGGVKNMRSVTFYSDFVQAVNQTVGRKALTVDQLQQLIWEAKRIRQRYGVMGLMSFASDLPYRFFTHEEIEKMKNSPYYVEFSSKMIDLMVMEGVLTPMEARLLKRHLTK